MKKFIILKYIVEEHHLDWGLKKNKTEFDHLKSLPEKPISERAWHRMGTQWKTLYPMVSGKILKR